ncbi:uncharacterized protein LOC143019700 [Oratosquilla oratoria]|uniref:uncharacterized protein LOC143019700 n=1 Tax=Oratosquilla oratoria TaxID=337810 RepID=UPI003F7717F1
MAAEDALCSLKRLLITGSNSKLYSGGHVIHTMIEWYNANEKRKFIDRSSEKETPETRQKDALRSVDPSKALLDLANMVPILISEGKGDLVLETLKEYAKLQYFDKEALVLCLVVAAKQPDQKNLVTKCYSLVKELCPTTYMFFLFIQLSEIISKANDKTGWGRGLRRAVNYWYRSKDPKQLALEVTRYRSVLGWEHKDVIKLAHIRMNDLCMGTQVVLHYVFTGLEKTKEVYETKENTGELLELLTALNIDEKLGSNFKTETVINKGQKVHENYGKVSFHDIPSQSLKSSEVWSHLLEKFDHDSLLASVGRLSKSNLLNEPSSYFLADILKDQFATDDCIKDTNPSAALLTLHAYTHPSKFPDRLKEEKKMIDTAHGLAVRKMTSNINVRRNAEASGVVIKALNKLVAQAAQQRRKPDGCMALCINVHHQMTTSTVWANNPEGKGEVTAGQAAVVTALTLAGGSSQHTVFGLTKDGLKSIEIPQGECLMMEDLIKKFKDVREHSHKTEEKKEPGAPWNISVEGVFKWAQENSKAVNTFVILTNKVDQDFIKGAVEELTSYNKNSGRDRSRLIVCGLSCKTLKAESNDDVFVMQGFGKNTPSIIQAFHEKHF